MRGIHWRDYVLRKLRWEWKHSGLHIHDNNNFEDSHSLPYLGKMDWDDILRALGEIDYQGHFTYEVIDFLRAFPDDVVLASEKFMHDLGRSMMRKIEEYRIKK